jgi:Ca2+-binding EF-hand superfamily protein
MGLNLKYDLKASVPINFSKEEISVYIKRFRGLDTSNKGYITHKDLKAFLKVCKIIIFSFYYYQELRNSLFVRLLVS